MIRPASMLALAALFVACGGDPNPRTPLTSNDASGSIYDIALDGLPIDIPLGDGGTLPDGFLPDILPPDGARTDAAPPTDGPVSRYACPPSLRLTRLAQPLTMVNAGPLGTMNIYQVPASVVRAGDDMYYVARDATGWGIHRVPATGTGADTVVLRTEGAVTHLAVVGRRLLFRPAGDASSIESVDLMGGGRRVEFSSVAVADGPYEDTRPFGDESQRFAFAIRTTGGVRSDRVLLLRKPEGGPEEVIFSRRLSPGAFMPRFAATDHTVVISTTRGDAATEPGLLIVPFNRPALTDPTAMQDDSALTFAPYTTMFGPGAGPPGVNCSGSCVNLAVTDQYLYCVRLSGCAPDNAPSLRRFRFTTGGDILGLAAMYATVYDLPGMVGARGPAQVGRIAALRNTGGAYVIMNLPAPAPGRTRHDLLFVDTTSTAVTAIGCDIPGVFGFGPQALSINAANEPDMWWGVWTWPS